MIKINHIMAKTKNTQNKAFIVLSYTVSSCNSWSLADNLKYTANTINPPWIINIIKKTINPAHNLKKRRKSMAMMKLHAREPAIAHLVTYRSEIQVASLSTLKKDQLIKLADASLAFSPLKTL